MSEISSLFVVSVLGVASLLRPWVAIVSILTLEVIGTMFPSLAELRALSVVAVCGSFGVLPYVAKGEVGRWAVLWPIVFFIAYVSNYLISGLMPASFLYLLAGAFCSFYLAMYGIRTRKQALFIAWSAILVSVIASLSSFFDFQSAAALSQVDEVYAGRVHAATRTFIGNPNYLFPLVIPGLFFSVMLYVASAIRPLKTVLLLCIGVIVLGVMATLSRGSIVALLALLLCVLVLRGGVSVRRWLLVAVPVTLIVIVGYYAFPEIFSLTAERFRDGDDVQSVGSRSYLAVYALKQFVSSPVFGVGLGATVSSLGTTQHDGFMAILGEMGLFGFVIYYSFPFVLLYRVHKARKSIPRSRIALLLSIMEAFMIGILVLNVFNIIVYSKTVQLLMAIIFLSLLGVKGMPAGGSIALGKLFGFFDAAKQRH